MHPAVVFNHHGSDEGETEKDRGHRDHDYDLVAGDAHVPKWKVPDNKSDRGEVGPKDEPTIDICSCIKHSRPVVWAFKGGRLNEGRSSSNRELVVLRGGRRDRLTPSLSRHLSVIWRH